MTMNLKSYFPMIRIKMEVLEEIRSKLYLSELFNKWKEGQQKEFLDFCTGVRGIKLLYDSFFKEIINPEYTPERLEEFLTLRKRCACYSADLLLRQYKRVRSEKKGNFSYKDIKQVYTIVLFEKSPKAFHDFPSDYRHRMRQESDTGIKIRYSSRPNRPQTVTHPAH